jgi:hypothetical protein
MLGPYRVPGPVEPDSHARPEIRCSAVRTVGCGTMPPAPPRFPASIGGALSPARRPVPARFFLQTLTAAATLLLLVASASLAAFASTLVITRLRQAPAQDQEQLQIAGVEQRESVQTAASTPSLRAAGRGGFALAALGPETHAVDELWRRARERAAEGADVTLLRASLPQAATASWTNDPSYLRVLPATSRAGLPGLRIVDLGAESAPALAGVRQGDVITAVNGHALVSPEDSARAFADVSKGYALVAEIERNGHRIALRVDWKG